jgi:C1A family cysteine protease
MTNHSKFKTSVSRQGARTLATLIALQTLTLTGCASVSFEDENEPGGPRPAATVYSENDGIPMMTLSDGKRVVLDRLELWEELRAQFPLPPETAPDEAEGFAESAEFRIGSKSLPRVVDLRSQQTPIRNQSGRGTCVAHATIAALEAAYQRERGVTLDLSEQYANHVQKMGHLKETPVGPTSRENQVGAWGGSGVGYQLGWLFRLRFGLPEEEAMAGVVAGAPSMTYIPFFNYEKTDQTGDVPWMSGRDATLTQRTVDRWNLNAERTAFSIPEPMTSVNFPREAPASATYGASRVRAVDPGLSSIKDELAAGREVAFAVGLTRPQPCTDGDDELPQGDPRCVERDAERAAEFADGIWRPLETAWGGHAMLIVGYDDDLRAFIVKNSWGTDRSGRGAPVEAAAGTTGFIYMSYDWISRIADTYSVLETRDSDTWLNTQPFLGKWHVETELAMERADLAVYHLPGALPSSSLSGQIDRRIGTLHATDRSYRVNGSLRGDRMLASFDSPTIDASYDSTAGGTKIVAHRIDEDTLAGWTHPAGDFDTREPFFATIGDYPSMQFARETASNPVPLDFFGSWRIVGAGLDGVVEFVSSIRNGTYTPSDSGSAIAGVEIEINPRTYFSDPNDPCFVRITVPGAASVTLDGLLFCSTSTSANRALITGIGDETGVGDPRGFYAYRERLDPAIVIQSPADGSVVSRGRRHVELRARTLGFTEPAVIRWTSDIDGFIGESVYQVSRNNLSFGTHIITASTTAPGGWTLSESVELTISNDPPTVDVLTPNGVDSFCAGEDIEFLATSLDLNNTPTFGLPESAIEWTVAGGAYVGTGHAVSNSFAAGGYNIVVRATDDQGEFAEDSVNLQVETCVNEPPVPTILLPSVNSGTSDGQYAYDGFDDARGQWYTDVTFVGTGQDPEDGTLPGSSLTWTTNNTDVQSGTLGTGNDVSVRLYSDTCFGMWHEVKLTVEDSGGQKRNATRRIFIWTVC